jgi:hypothetical protein
MSKLVLIIPHCLPDVGQLITHHFSEYASWWHWSPDVWLLSFNTERSAVSVRDEVKGLLPEVMTMVLEFPDDHWAWAGFGPIEWTEWFNRFWRK